MSKKNCILCGEEVLEDCEKLKGTMLKIVDDKKKSFVYVCSSCMKKDEKWLEKAKIKGA
jgi:hypothetical protein